MPEQRNRYSRRFVDRQKSSLSLYMQFEHARRLQKKKENNVSVGSKRWNIFATSPSVSARDLKNVKNNICI